MKPKIRSFYAVDDSGKRYTIFEIIRFMSAPSFGAENDVLEELPEFKLQDGQRLNRINNDEFEIVATGKRLRVV